MDVLPYPHRLGGALPLGVAHDGRIVGVDATTHILVAGAIGSGCSSLMRTLLTSALETGLRVTAVDGTAPGFFSTGAARHDYDAVTDSRLELEDGTTHPVTVMKDLVAGRRTRPDLLILDDAFDLAKVADQELIDMYQALAAVGVHVAARVLTARLHTRDAYGTRILMGHATPMDRHLMLGDPEAPRVRRGDPPGTGIIRYSDGTETSFRAYWTQRGAPQSRATAS